jgi:hypothetical protein
MSRKIVVKRDDGSVVREGLRGKPVPTKRIPRNTSKRK